MVPVGGLVPIFEALHAAGVLELLDGLEAVANADALAGFLAVERIGVQAAAELLRLLGGRDRLGGGQAGGQGEGEDGEAQAAGIGRHG